MSVLVKTGERWIVAVEMRRIPTVMIEVNGVAFSTDVADDVEAMRVAVSTARALGVRLGLEP